MAMASQTHQTNAVMTSSRHSAARLSDVFWRHPKLSLALLLSLPLLWTHLIAMIIRWFRSGRLMTGEAL